MTTLKPCAHCGGDAEMDTQRAYRNLRSGNIGSAVAIYCLRCGIDVSFCHEDHSGLELENMIHMATETWNRRPDDTRPNLEAPLRKLAKIVAEFHEFHDRCDKPCGEWGRECPIGMTEWVDAEDRQALSEAHAAIATLERLAEEEK